MIDDSSSVPLKQCSKCGDSFPATTDFFGRDKQTRDGLYPTCKACRKAYYAAHVDEQSLEYHRQYYQDHKEGLSQKSKVRNEANKEQRRQYNIAHRARNAERARQYRQTPKNQTYAKGYREQSYQAHRIERIEKQRQYHEANREEINARQRQRGKTEQGRIAGKVHKQNRKAQKRASIGSYTARELQAQFQRQKGKCYWCKVKLGEIWHADHVVPLARGGSNTIGNIVAACPTCNMRKNDKLPHEWPEGGRLL